MKYSSWVLILFLGFLGCESMDHQKVNSGTPASSTEPSWASFAKENNMDWSEHYWSDREKKGNQGYLERKPFDISESRSHANTAPLQEVKEKPAASEEMPIVSQKGRDETVKKISAPEFVKKEEKVPVIQKIIQPSKNIEKQKLKIKEYIVKKGESLWKIAGLKEIYGNSAHWQKIYEANRSKLKSPNHVYPGQVLIIPRE